MTSFLGAKVENIVESEEIRRKTFFFFFGFVGGEFGLDD